MSAPTDSRQILTHAGRSTDAAICPETLAGWKP